MKEDAIHPAAKGDLLLVEDDPVSAHAYTTLFRKGGYNVTHIADGKDALVTLYHTDFVAVVMDLMLPSMDGLEVLGKMREMPRHSETPAFVLTSADLSIARDSARQKGVARFLTKGQTSPAEILAAVDLVVGEKAQPQASKLRVIPIAPIGTPKRKDPAPDPIHTDLIKPKPSLLERLFRKDKE